MKIKQENGKWKPANYIIACVTNYIHKVKAKIEHNKQKKQQYYLVFYFRRFLYKHIPVWYWHKDSLAFTFQSWVANYSLIRVTLYIFNLKTQVSSFNPLSLVASNAVKFFSTKRINQLHAKVCNNCGIQRSQILLYQTN